MTNAPEVKPASTPSSKKGRAKKTDDVKVNTQSIVNDTDNKADSVDDATKKRGRKPRGGKLVVKQVESQNTLVAIPNVILHLRCTTKDLSEYNNKLNKIVKNPLEYTPEVPPTITTYNETELTENFATFSSGMDTTQDSNIFLPNLDIKDIDNSQTQYICSECNKMNVHLHKENISAETVTFVSEDTDNANLKEINQKLKQLKVQLQKNTIPNDVKPACFWCTYDYDNEPCYIPKHIINETIYGYGSFCRPQCGVAYLMKEPIDDSTKFERYHLMNKIYGKVYNFKKNIKPAPSPYYLLKKFYGNLSIQEYRRLLMSEHLLMVVEKPMTRILPELHEDTDDLMLNVYGIDKSSQPAVSSGGCYKVKRQSEKQQGPSKSSIIRNKFGLSSSAE